jgi:2-haloacid dehalogenase
MEKVPSDYQPKAIVFDVYETLLDMKTVRRRVNSIMNSKRAYIIWFELFMQYTFVDNSTVQFHDFISIAEATLKMTGEIFDRDVSSDDTKGVLELLKSLPLNEGVSKGLSSLNEKGFRIAALTNCTEKIVTDRMVLTGLESYFEKVYSAEHVQKYKPALGVYQWVARELELKPGEILMVSAHGWDIAGAENAGMRTAYLQQGNQLLYPLAPAPDFICKSVPDLCEQLSANRVS